jgi:cellulose synthase operon protein YhjQ
VINAFDNDITDLCQVAGINTSNYLNFARTRAVTEKSQILENEPAQTSALDNLSQVTPNQEPDPASVTDPASEFASQTPAPTSINSDPIRRISTQYSKAVEITARVNRFQVRKPMNRGERWQGLQSALDEANLQSSSAQLHQTTNILLFPSSGGVGITTMAATLARILSSHKSPVGILENSNQSLIPMHFGAKRARTGSSTFFVSRGTNAAPVHLITPKAQQEGMIPFFGSTASPSNTEEWVSDGLNEVSEECEYLMVDIWANMSMNLLTRLASKSICIIPLLPEVRSTLRVRPILELFHNLSLKIGSRIEPQFILTKFDHNVSLHTDLRKWLGDELKSRLLPIVIRRSDEVSEALAEGETIVDYAPNSGVSEDFHRLAEWLQTRSQSTESTTYTRSAATGD